MHGHRAFWWGLGLVFATWGVYVLVLWPRMLFWSPEGLTAGWVGVWADWGAHLTYAQAFAERPFGAWLTEHPVFAGAKFTYPFVADAISGLLIRAGIELVPAFLVPSLVATALLLVALYAFFMGLTRSVGQAVLALTLFLANGGLGVWWFLRAVLAQPSWQTLLSPPREYTHMRELGIEWVNIVTAQLIPQRAFLLGLPIVLVILLVLVRWTRRDFTGVSPAKLVGLGLGASLLVPIHMHSFIALALLCAGWAALTTRFWRSWLTFGLAAAVPGIALFGWLYGGHVTPATPLGVHPSFFRWYPGWMANPEQYGMNILYFWWINWGLFLPLAALATWRLRSFRHPLVWSAWAVFALSHLVLFQPFNWDNTKILTYAALVLSAPVAALLASWWRRGWAARVGAAAAFVVLTASGFLDLWYILRTEERAHVMATPAEVRLAQAFRAVSQPPDRVLTADYHLHWVPMLAGRQILLGYRGWLWTYGIDYTEREQDVRTMFAGGPGAEALLAAYRVRFVVIGPHERTTFAANEEFFRSRYQAALAQGDTRVYRVRD